MHMYHLQRTRSAMWSLHFAGVRLKRVRIRWIPMIPPVSAPPARQAAQPCEPAMVSKAKHSCSATQVTSCPTTQATRCRTCSQAPRHRARQTHRCKATRLDTERTMSPHMLLVTLGAGLQLRGLHAHIVKSSMHAHALMRLRHAPRSAKPGGREAADASVFRCTAAGTACKSKSWLEVSNQKAYPKVGKTTLRLQHALFSTCTI